MKKKLANAHNYLNNHKIFKWPYSFFVIVMGIIFVLSGIIMLVIPGPGVLTILLGTAILSTQFKWAKKFLNYSLNLLKTLKSTIQQ